MFGGEKTEVNNIGIGLEMIGFFLFLVSAKRLPEADVMGFQSISDDSAHPFWYKFYVDKTGNWYQLGRLVGICLVMIGLAMQVDYDFLSEIKISL